MTAMRWACTLAAALLIGVPARAADRVVQMTHPAPLRPDFAAIPEIADPVDAAEQAINAAVRRLDKVGIAAVCTGKRNSWERSVETTMHGPRFLSFVVHDDIYCGGAHPDEAAYAIVYDLSSGRPVDWTKLLPPSLTGNITLQPAADGTRTVYLASAELMRRFSKAQHPQDPVGCEGTTDFDDVPPMQLWLDAAAGGLAAMPDVAHVVQACYEPLVIPVADLRKLGAAPALVDALEAARKVH